MCAGHTGRAKLRAKRPDLGARSRCLASILVALGLLCWSGGCTTGGNAPRATADIGPQFSEAPPAAEQAYSIDMLALGHFGNHVGWINPLFVAKRIAPLLKPEPGPEIRTASATR